MTAEETAAHERARTLIRRLHEACSELVGNERFTIVLAVPVPGDSRSMAIETAGNATRLLTETMLDRAILQHWIARQEVDG